MSQQLPNKHSEITINFRCSSDSSGLLIANSNIFSSPIFLIYVLPHGLVHFLSMACPPCFSLHFLATSMTLPFFIPASLVCLSCLNFLLDYWPISSLLVLRGIHIHSVQKDYPTARKRASKIQQKLSHRDQPIDHVLRTIREERQNQPWVGSSC